MAKEVNLEDIGTKPNNRTVYDNKAYITPEMRAYMADLTDPLVLCFKLMIDFDKPYGLFASSGHIDSALNYLSRIGETMRYEMLLQWIDNFKKLIVDYDFLILGVDGIDEITNTKIGTQFIEEETKLSFLIRETPDMFIQSLITEYKNIWFDNVRCVEVLPANLRRFDVGILVFNAGYYDMDTYDDVSVKANNNELTQSQINQSKVFPTLRKLSSGVFSNNLETIHPFNHTLVVLGDAQIDCVESGKTFFDGLSNEMNDTMVKNTLALNYRFGSHSGVYNNTFGEMNFVKQLETIALSSRYYNLQKAQEDSGVSTTKEKSSISKYFQSAKKSLVDVGKGTISNIASKSEVYLKRVAGKNTPVGNIYNNVKNPAALSKVVDEAIGLGIDYAENATINKWGAKANNIILANYPNNITEAFELINGSKKKHSNISVEETKGTTADETYTEAVAEKNSEEMKNQIQVKQYNVYNRGGF